MGKRRRRRAGPRGDSKIRTADGANEDDTLLYAIWPPDAAGESADYFGAWLYIWRGNRVRTGGLYVILFAVGFDYLDA